MDELESIPVLKTDASLGELQSSRLAQLRKDRDQQSVDVALAAIRKAAASQRNLFEPVIQAVRCRATLGEIMGELKQEFGTYMAPSGF